MRRILLFIFLPFVFCCKREPEKCDLNYLDGFSYDGHVVYCNAQAGQQVVFVAKASLRLDDSAFIITILSIDTVMANFIFTDTALVECIYGEGKINYRLNPLSNQGENIGHLSSNGNTLWWKIFLDPCFESTYFNGYKE